MTGRRSRGGLRAYRPSRATVALVAEIKARDGVAAVDIIAPSRGSHPRPTMLRVTLEPQGMNFRPVWTDFYLGEARRWLEADKEGSL